MGTDGRHIPTRHYASHSRHWRDNVYVYPVISRRSGGLSIGINLNPDTACNFDCVYCQVDRSAPPRVHRVDPDVVGRELVALIQGAVSGKLFDDHAFRTVGAPMRRITDIALSGDGEPTTCVCFLEAVKTIARIKAEAGLDDVKIVLITDACYLRQPKVEQALGILDESNGEIWAKLDAGTEAYFQAVNRPNFSLDHVIDNIAAAAQVRPVVIQAMFLRMNGRVPGGDEIAAFCDRLREIGERGGRLSYVQVYTVARRTAEACVTPATDQELSRIADQVRRTTGLRVETYHD